MKNAKVNFDSYMTAIADIENIESMSHTDEFKIVNDKNKAIAYIHVRKYSVDMYVKQDMTETLSDYIRSASPTLHFDRIYVKTDDARELYDMITTVNADYSAKHADDKRSAENTAEAIAKRKAEAQKRKAEAKQKQASKRKTASKTASKRKA